MNRTEFDNAYREARVALKTFSALSNDRYRGRFVTAGERRAAEERWISWQKVPKMTPVLKAVHDSLHLGGTISNAALHDLRHCGGHRRDWYLRMARESRERVA